ncbi:MAG: rod shape-determining protein MreD [Alphaproteobacteria bacterium]|nr:rod shape-determining protein MreD [Alphaproteobacteria bacterium]
MSEGGIGAGVAAFGRRIVPGFTLVLLVFLTHLHVPIPHFSDIAPALPLMGIYYWVVFRPDLMPRVLVFAVGLFQDALIGAPFGLTALVYLVAHSFVLSQRRYIVGKPFWIFWAGFAIVAPAAGALTWMLASALRGAVLPGDVVLASVVLTVFVFPLVAWLLLRMQRWLVGAAEPA